MVYDGEEFMGMNVYVARQPILNRNKKVLAYEMLYRYSAENVFKEGMDGTTATKNLIHDLIMNFGFDHITNNKTAFINFTGAVLLTDIPFLLEPEKVKIELLEDIIYTDELVERVLYLKEKGYSFAIDDYIGQQIPEKVLDAVDIIKVDFMLTTPEKRVQIAKQFKDKKILLAEKVETEEEFAFACEHGYTMFQGYLFSKPVIHFRPANDVSMATYSRLMREFRRKSVDFDILTEIIEKDMNASYHLIQRANTLQYFRGNRMPNLKTALLMMGVDEVQRWIMLLLLKSYADQKTESAIYLALVRAVFMERLIQIIDHRADEKQAYMVGLFSMIDNSSKKVLQEMGGKNSNFTNMQDIFDGKGGFMSELLEFVIRYEKNQDVSEEEKIQEFLDKYHLKAEEVAYLYVSSVAYSDVALET